MIERGEVDMAEEVGKEGPEREGPGRESHRALLLMPPSLSCSVASESESGSGVEGAGVERSGVDGGGDVGVEGETPVVVWEAPAGLSVLWPLGPHS